MAAERNRRRIAAGVLFAGLVLAALLLWRWNSERGTTVEAVFDSVNGLVDGAEVVAGGEHVGSVERIDLGDDDGLPHVTLHIDPGYSLRQGATADVRMTSLSGEVNRVVSVEEGDGPVLADGATIGRASTDQPVEVEQVLSTLDPRTRADVRGVLRGMAASLDERGPDVEHSLRASAEALGETAGLLDDVTTDGAALRRLVRSTARVSGALARSPGTTGDALESFSSLMSHTATREASLRETTARLEQGLAAPTRALDAVRGAVPGARELVRAALPAGPQLAPAAAELRDALVAAQPAVTDARALVEDAPPALAELAPLAADARPLVARLTPTLQNAAPILNETRARLPDFFSFFANWADFTSNYDANGHGARVGLVFPPAPLQPVSGDEAGPGHLLAPFLRAPGVLEGEPWTDYEDSFVGGGE